MNENIVYNTILNVCVCVDKTIYIGEERNCDQVAANKVNDAQCGGLSQCDSIDNNRSEKKYIFEKIAFF